MHLPIWSVVASTVVSLAVASDVRGRSRMPRRYAGGRAVRTVDHRPCCHSGLRTSADILRYSPPLALIDRRA